MTTLAICSSDIDWSATGTWVGSIATLIGVGVAIWALNSWKAQIKLQDRYQKTDGLLKSFVQCLRTGHDWQLSLGIGVGRNMNNLLNDQFRLWKSALMQYRLDWDLAQMHFDKNKGEELWFSPNSLQSTIIITGNLLDKAETSFQFFPEMENLISKGVDEIRRIKISK